MRNYYSAAKSQLGWLNLLHSPTLPPPVTAKHRVVKFQMSLSNEQMATVGNIIKVGNIQTRRQ